MFDLSLLDPGRAVDFFTLTRGIAFNAGVATFDKANALWLAELSRLAYRRSGSESHRHPGPTRGDFLSTVGMKESAFFDSRGTEAVLVDADQFRVLAFRGTEPQRLQEDFITDAEVALEERTPFVGSVHTGFAEALVGDNGVWPSIEQAIRAGSSPLYLTGHSLGGALAVLTSSLCAANKIPFVATYTFGCPRVGDERFRDAIKPLPVFRVVNDRDLVPRVFPFHLGYRHAGGLAQIAHNGELQQRFNEDDRAEPILLPVDELLDHVPLHYVQKLRKIVDG